MIHANSGKVCDKDCSKCSFKVLYIFVIFMSLFAFIFALMEFSDFFFFIFSCVGELNSLGSLHVYMFNKLFLKPWRLSGPGELLGAQSRARRVCRRCSSTGWWNTLLPRLCCVARQLLEHNLDLSDEV